MVLVFILTIRREGIEQTRQQETPCWRRDAGQGNSHGSQATGWQDHCTSVRMGTGRDAGWIRTRNRRGRRNGLHGRPQSVPEPERGVRAWDGEALRKRVRERPSAYEWDRLLLGAPETRVSRHLSQDEPEASTPLHHGVLRSA